MQSLSSLLKRIVREYASYEFIEGEDFIWSPQANTVMYRQPAAKADIWTLLHEIAHAELGHQAYDLDVELITREVEAWAHASTVLAPRHSLTIDPEHIEYHLGTYRHWLHSRSQCPACGQNGFQETKNTYRCNNCRCLWRANEARICALRRIRLPNRSQTS